MQSVFENIIAKEIFIPSELLDNPTLAFEFLRQEENRINTIKNEQKTISKNVMKKNFLKLKGVIGDRLYSGFHGYHQHKSERHNYMKKSTGAYGYNVGIELEVEIPSDTKRKEFFDKKSNWFYLESDGSLGHGGVEIITIPMKPQAAYNVSTWDGLTSYLTSIGGVSHNTSTCGLHVHISRSAFGLNSKEIDSTVSKVLHMYENELGAGGYGRNFIRKVMRREYGSYRQGLKDSLNDKQKSVLEISKEDGIGVFKKDYYEKTFEGCGTQGERYSSINRSNSVTIEFRQGKGTLKPESICSTVRFCCEIVEFCRKNSAENITRDKFFKHIASLKDDTDLKVILR